MIAGSHDTEPLPLFAANNANTNSPTASTTSASMIASSFFEPRLVYSHDNDDMHSHMMKTIEPTPIDRSSVVVVDEIPLSGTVRRSLVQAEDFWRDCLEDDSLRGSAPIDEGRLGVFCNSVLKNFPVVQGRIDFTEEERSKSATISLSETPPPRSSSPRRGLDHHRDTPSRPRRPASQKIPGPRRLSSKGSHGASHADQWNKRYSELLDFKKAFGHCLVPLKWAQLPSLAHWVKRQRYQFKMKQEGKNSSITDERQKKLEEVGFIWDSHAAGWQARLAELLVFRDENGHCNVPKKYSKNPQLAVWVKCQRRQFKLFARGDDKSNMTADRAQKLSELGFVFSPTLQRKLPSSA